MLDLQSIILIGASYLLGGIPTGYLVAKRLKGLDIRRHGSGNPGTANVYRVAGARAGAITLTVDALKGFVPVLLAQRVAPGDQGLALACGASAIIGHDWTPFLGFKGGKGVATSAGVFAALAPCALAIAAASFALAVWASGHISVGSLSGAAALPLAAVLLDRPGAVCAFAAAAGVLIVYKHIPNIRRLAGGSELGVDGGR